MKKLLWLLLLIIVVLLAVLAWSPWITEDFARDKVVNRLTVVDKFGDTEVFCYFSDFSGGVPRKIPFGVLVSGTVTCSLPKSVLSNKTFFVSPFATVHQIK